MYELEPLPYAHDELPGISPTTLDVHHGRHHRAYVDRLNQLIAASPLNGKPLEEVVRTAEGALFNNAAQVWNHAFYWRCMTPQSGLTPPTELASAIQRDFGSADRLIQELRGAALSKFGSGWTWLVADKGRMRVLNTDDAGNPLRDRLTPLLTCDVWEHAYYIDYLNERARYVDAFLRLINWAFVCTRLATAEHAQDSRSRMR